MCPARQNLSDIFRNFRLIAEVLTVLHCCYLHKLYHNWKEFGIIYLFICSAKYVFLFKYRLTVCTCFEGILCQLRTWGMFVFYGIWIYTHFTFSRSFQVEGYINRGKLSSAHLKSLLPNFGDRFFKLPYKRKRQVVLKSCINTNNAAWLNGVRDTAISF